MSLKSIKELLFKKKTDSAANNYQFNANEVQSADIDEQIKHHGCADSDYG